MISQLHPPALGETWSAWSPGILDIHHINTGKGNAALFILPDGTTLLVDAGEMNPTSPRYNSPLTAPIQPNDSRTPGEWLVRYIQYMLDHQAQPKLDYVILTHFHEDHLGIPSALAKPSAKGDYVLTGLSMVGEHIPMGKILDRGWPNYDYPLSSQDPTLVNYRAFINWHIQHRNLQVERFQAGVNHQLCLLNQPTVYDNFEFRNIALNGEVWTGVGSNTRQHFPPLKDLSSAQYPDENMCSIAFRLSYGKFDYFAGADLTGVLEAGKPHWYDVETPVAQVVGPVEVNVVNHHGNRSSANEYLLQALRPRIHILQTWSSDHPGHGVLRRLFSTHLYPGPRDVFMTNFLKVNKLVIGPLADRVASDQGHIVVRVEPGGERYWVFILDDTSEQYQVKAVHGPYQAR